MFPPVQTSAGGPDSPEVWLSVFDNDSDPDHPCPPVDGVKRQQVKWEFLGDAPPEVPAGLRGEMVLMVTADGLAPDIYYNELFWEAEADSTPLSDFTCGASPVYARFRQWDVTSSARGTTMNARATMRGEPDFALAIMSLQADDGTPIAAIPPNSTHVDFLCGRGLRVDEAATTWEAYVQATVHDENHDPVANATVSGVWDPIGFGMAEFECVTDVAGRCQVRSATLPTADQEMTFTVDDITHATLTYYPEYNSVSDLTVDRPK